MKNEKTDILISVVRAELEALRETARKHREEFAQAKTALAILHAVKQIELAINTAMERLVSPAEAAAYCGYSERHLRRVAENYGTRSHPRYKLSELSIKPGHRASSSDAGGSEAEQVTELGAPPGEAHETSRPTVVELVAEPAAQPQEKGSSRPQARSTEDRIAQRAREKALRGAGRTKQKAAA